MDCSWDDESLNSYCKRLSDQIDKDGDIVLIGVSFGGMIAVELARIISVHKLIIISSISSDSYLPWYYRVLGFLKIHSIIPARILKQTNPFAYWIFGAKSLEEKKLLKSIFKDTDVRFLRWALGVIPNWKSFIIPDNFIHIHGTSDKILPVCKTAHFKIKDGEHLMMYSKAEEISVLLNSVLQS